MANVFIEARPKGHQQGTRIDDYVVEDHADHVLETFKTSMRRLIGRKSRDTIHSLLVFGISTIRKSPTTGEPLNKI
jgi:hypothetical protein